MFFSTCGIFFTLFTFKIFFFFHFIQFEWQDKLGPSQGWQPVYHKKKIMEAYCGNSSAKSIINQKDISAQACHLRKEDNNLYLLNRFRISKNSSKDLENKN